MKCEPFSVKPVLPWHITAVEQSEGHNLLPPAWLLKGGVRLWCKTARAIVILKYYVYNFIFYDLMLYFLCFIKINILIERPLPAITCGSSCLLSYRLHNLRAELSLGILREN